MLFIFYRQKKSVNNIIDAELMRAHTNTKIINQKKTSLSCKNIVI